MPLNCSSVVQVPRDKELVADPVRKTPVSEANGRKHSLGDVLFSRVRGGDSSDTDDFQLHEQGVDEGPILNAHRPTLRRFL
jgi:hypothetical protein